MEILKRDDLSVKEKAKLIAKEYLPEKHREDLVEVGAALLTGIVLAGKKKAKEEGKKEKDAVQEIIEAIKKAKEGEES